MTSANSDTATTTAPRVSKGIPKKPQRPAFDARDAKLQKLHEKVKEYNDVAKEKTSEIDALVNEARANNKLEGLKRTLANTVHTRTQLEVRH
jgi:hypothetical protein